MANIIPVITLYQPWATWIMRGWKPIETRTHNKFAVLKGQTVGIHAGKTTDPCAINNPYLTKEQILYNPDEVINSHILGTVECFDFRMLTEADSVNALIDCGSVKRFGSFLKDVKLFEKPIPCSGELGIWYYDLDSMKKVKKPIPQQNTLFQTNQDKPSTIEP